MKWKMAVSRTGNDSSGITKDNALKAGRWTIAP